MIEQPRFKFGLGDEVKDKVTGFKGAISGRTEWLYGCRRYTVQPTKLKDGKPMDPLGFDEAALILIKAAGPGQKVQPRKGGPRAEPGRAPAAARRR